MMDLRNSLERQLVTEEIVARVLAKASSDYIEKSGSPDKWNKDQTANYWRELAFQVANFESTEANLEEIGIHLVKGSA